MRRTMLLGLVFGLVILQQGLIRAQSPAAKPPLRVLFIGNSYTSTNNLPDMLVRLSAAGRQRPVVATQQTPGGCTFERHCRDRVAGEKIASRPWDFVVLQEQSVMPVCNPQSTLSWGKQLAAAASGRGAKVVFFETWARAEWPGMQQPLTNTYRQLAAEANARVAPVGKAWQRVLSATPKPALHSQDGSHPTAAGTYLAACVFYGTIHGQSPVGLPGAVAGLDQPTASDLQKAAWAAVLER